VLSVQAKLAGVPSFDEAVSSGVSGQQAQQSDLSFAKQRAERKARVNKVEGITVKQKVTPKFNPKEIAVDQSVPAQRSPKNSSRYMKSRSPHVFGLIVADGGAGDVVCLRLRAFFFGDEGANELMCLESLVRRISCV